MSAFRRAYAVASRPLIHDKFITPVILSRRHISSRTDSISFYNCYERLHEAAEASPQMPLKRHELFNESARVYSYNLN